MSTPFNRKCLKRVVYAFLSPVVFRSFVFCFVLRFFCIRLRIHSWLLLVDSGILSSIRFATLPVSLPAWESATCLRILLRTVIHALLLIWFHVILFVPFCVFSSCAVSSIFGWNSYNVSAPYVRWSHLLFPCLTCTRCCSCGVYVHTLFFALLFSRGFLPPLHSYWGLSCDHGLDFGDEWMWKQQQREQPPTIW